MWDSIDLFIATDKKNVLKNEGQSNEDYEKEKIEALNRVVHLLLKNNKGEN